MKSLKKIRLVWLVALGILVLYLLWQAIVPLGKISYQTDFLTYDYFISELSPQERLRGQEGEGQRTITSEPVYFYLRTPRPFRTAHLTMTVDNPSGVMEIGLCRDKASWQFERQPLYVESLEKLANSQNVIQAEGIMLWQKEKTYSSIKDFLASPPTLEKIAIYNYNLKLPFRLADYKSISEKREIFLGARGGYTVVTYSDGSPIEVNFEMQVEKNKASPASTIFFTLYNEQGGAVMIKEMSEKDILSSSTYIFKSGSLEPGPYRIEVKASNEVVTEKITTSQTQISFANQLWLTERGRKNFSLLTDGSYIKVQTLNPKSLQTIEIEKESINLSETYQQFSLTLSDHRRTPKQIRLTTDDVMIATDGILTFREEDILNPTPRSYSPNLALDSAGVDYMIARYQPIGISSSIKRTMTFIISDTCLDKGRSPFLIAAPGIQVDQGTEIKEIVIQLEGKTLFEFIHDIWKKIKA